MSLLQIIFHKTKTGETAGLVCFRFNRFKW